MDLGIIQLIVDKYGLDLVAIAATSGVVIVLLNALKRVLPFMSGGLILIPAITLSFGVTALAYQPEWIKVILAGALVLGGSVGLWETSKMLAHKAGGTVATTGIGVNGHEEVK